MKNSSYSTALNFINNDDELTHYVVRTYSGLTITLSPTYDEIGAISVRDIAQHLSKIAYFPESGQAPFTAAQYACELAASLKSAAPHVQLYGFLKNSHEAYLGHIPPAVRAAEKAMAGQQWGMDNRDVLEAGFTARIFTALGLQHLYAIFESGSVAIEALTVIKHAQNRLNSTLERDLDAYIYRPRQAERAEPFPRVIAPLRWEYAAEKYIRTYEQLIVRSRKAIRSN